MSTRWLCLLLLVLWILTVAESRDFRAYTYDEIVTKLEKWRSEYPQLFKLHTAREKYNLYLPPRLQCSQTLGQCEHHIIILTNHSTWQNDLSRPHVFFSGALHGNERVGPNAVVELCDYLLFESAHNEWIQYLLNHRVLIIMPMTNAIGYARSQREEQRSLDPNRDFPYDINDPSKCMKTIVARIVNEIFREYLIQLAITFHGGMRSITLEWGAPNHPTPKDYSPDHIAQLDMVSNMQFLGGHLPSKSARSKKQWYYPIGTLNKVVYPVQGGMEDWAYAGSWDTQFVHACEPQTYLEGEDKVGAYSKEKTIYNKAQLRAFNFLIEASDNKQPGTNWGNLKNDWNDIWQIDHHEHDGHIARNMRISLFVINSAQPYVMVRTYPKKIAWNMEKHTFLTSDDAERVNIGWFVSGAISVYDYDVLYACTTSNGRTRNVKQIEWNVLQFDKDAQWRKNLDLTAASDTHLHDAKKKFKFTIEMETKLSAEWIREIVSGCKVTRDTDGVCRVWMSIRVKVDDQWLSNRDLTHNQKEVVKTYPEGMPPQSHVVNARNMEREQWNMSNHEYFVEAHQWWYADKPFKVEIHANGNSITQYNDANSKAEEVKSEVDNITSDTLVIEKKPSMFGDYYYLMLIGAVICLFAYCSYKRQQRNNGRNRRRYGDSNTVTYQYQRVPTTITIV